MCLQLITCFVQVRQLIGVTAANFTSRYSTMSVLFNFVGKKALVTGASQGIGYGIALELARNGAMVVALARNEEKLEQLRREHSNITAAVGDVSSSEATLSSLLASHHPFDFLINNAGVAVPEPCLNISEETLSKIIEVNLKAPIILAKIVANEMIRHNIRGAIVNVSSKASKRPINHYTSYCASKAGLDMATRCMAMELGQHGIRVNCVNPTVVMTEMGKSNWSDANKAAAMLSQLPLGKFAGISTKAVAFSEVKDVVNSVLFLLSDASAMTTGGALAVDGGFSNM